MSDLENGDDPVELRSSDHDARRMAILAIQAARAVLDRHVSSDAAHIAAVADCLEAMMGALEALLDGQGELHDEIRLFRRTTVLDSA